jgi:hypothetical protein
MKERKSSTRAHNGNREETNTEALLHMPVVPAAHDVERGERSMNADA